MEDRQKFGDKPIIDFGGTGSFYKHTMNPVAKHGPK